MNDDPLDLVASTAPAITPDTEVLAKVRSTLMQTIDAAETSAASELISIDGHKPRKGRKRRRILPIAAIAVVLAGATGTAWAVFGGGNSGDTTNLSCPSPTGPHSSDVDPDGQAIVGVVTGDPVLDCADAWRKMTTAEPPKMTAYDNGAGAVVVLPTRATAPAEYRRLAPGEYQHADAASLQRNLDDVATGLEAQCDGFEAAAQRTRKILDRLGMRGWTVEQGHPGRVADGTRNCAAAGVDAATHTVMIVGAGQQGDHPFRSFAQQVHDAVENSCLDVGEASKAVRDIAGETTVDNAGTLVDLGAPDVVGITPMHNPLASCTTVTVTVGGNVSVTLEGAEQTSGSDAK